MKFYNSKHEKDNLKVKNVQDNGLKYKRTDQDKIKTIQKFLIELPFPSAH